jgi:hypothetical protein
MYESNNNILDEHKSKLELLFKLLPLATPRYTQKLFIKKENKLNSILSEYIGKNYFLGLLENKSLDTSDDLYKNICDSYEYISNVLDNSIQNFEIKKINEFKTKLNLID